jgi:hypothetical protein
VGGGEEEQNGEDEQGRHRGVECGLEEETGVGKVPIFFGEILPDSP